MSQHLPLTKQADIDVYTALIAGLVSQHSPTTRAGSDGAGYSPGSSPCSPMGHAVDGRDRPGERPSATPRDASGGDPLDALTALQVGERRTWTPNEIVER